MSESVCKIMGKPTLFTIVLSSNNEVYFPGSNVEGKVLLELAEAKKVQGVSITFTGKAYVHYKELRERDGETYDYHFADTQDMFNDVLVQLWGDGKNSQQMAAGKYEFPF